MESRVVWKDGMAFDVALDGFTFGIDADPAFGGRGRGPMPKGLTLASLGGCTGMDVISILQKMRVVPSAFDVTVRGELADEHPKRFTQITVEYRFEGVDLPEQKLRRAVALSEERYCGVRATLAPVVDIHTVILVNGEELVD